MSAASSHGQRSTAFGRRPLLAIAALGAFALALACAPTIPAPEPIVLEPIPPAAEDSPAETQTPEPPLAPPPEPAEEPREEPRPLVPAGPLDLRVGLASDLQELTLPCCDREVSLELGAEKLTLSEAVRVRPGAKVERQQVYRLQVAALKDELQAQNLARELGTRLDQPAEAHFDAGIDLYRVRVGRYSTREEADRARQRLRTGGDTEGWVVTDGGAPKNPSLTVTRAGVERQIPGRWLVMRHDDDAGVRFGGKRYRGRLLIYLNDRGSLNIINELPLEDYLRGVVPEELGPAAYPRLEALKAQAVAARTYTLRNLGEFAIEGYDICGTPRCQVYGGMDVEHRLSDRAVGETEGQVLLWDGELIDALYSSTCGGHTENGGVIFPEKDFAYLRGVPCFEAGVSRLAGGLASGTAFPRGITRALLPQGSESSRALRLESRLEALAVWVGLPATEDRLRSTSRREVQRFVASAFDLALDARLFVADANVDYLLENPPADWSEEDRRRAAILAGTGLFEGSLERRIEGDEAEHLLFGLAQLLGVVRVEKARFAGYEEGVLSLRSSEGTRGVVWPQGADTYRQRSDRTSAAALDLVPGDRLRLYWRGERLLAVVQELATISRTHERSSRMSSWRRFKSDAELTARVEERYPGLGFRSFTVLDRGVSGRVRRIELEGENGKRIEVEGLAVRWTLDLPDNNFTARRASASGGRAGWQFNGSGWGHGVGMCQIGAYGMAGRGLSYRDILSHYYSGVQLARVRRPATAR